MRRTGLHQGVQRGKEVVGVVPGKVFSRDILLKDVWGTDVYVVDRTVDVHIRKIREKLDKFEDFIETVKGVGYRFKSVE